MGRNVGAGIKGVGESLVVGSKVEEVGVIWLRTKGRNSNAEVLGGRESSSCSKSCKWIVQSTLLVSSTRTNCCCSWG